MTRPTSVLHARVVANAGGGPDKTILRSARYLPRDRFALASVYIHPANDPRIARLVDQAHAHHMPMHTIPERGAIDRRALRHLTDLCRRRRIDIWHSHDYKTDILGIMLRRKLPGLRLVSTVHGFTRENLKTRFYARLNDLALRSYDRVLAVSPALLQHCGSRGVHPDRLTYLPNAIELDHYPYRQADEKAAARRALGLSLDMPVLGLVGRLSPEKGIDRALRLFAALLSEHKTASLHLVGDGPERERLVGLAQKLGIAHAVTFHGWCADTTPYLKAMDLMLLTSHTEGMPNAVLEAMALGVPVAATDVGGVPEMLARGHAGTLLPNTDETLWAQQVSAMLPYGSQKALLARKRVESHYSFDMRMKRVRLVYESLCPAPSLRSSAYRQAA